MTLPVLAMHHVDMPHELLDDKLVVWFDAQRQRVCFYDFDNDNGISLSVAEWEKTVKWAAGAVWVEKA